MQKKKKKQNSQKKPREAKRHRIHKGCLGVTWTGGHTGTFLDVLPLAGRASVQRRGVGAASAPLLPATPTHSTAGRPGGPRGPAAVDCQTNTGVVGVGWGGSGEVRGEGRMDEGTEQPGLPDIQKRGGGI